MNINTNVPVHNTNTFNWDPTTRRLTTWRWELGPEPHWLEVQEGSYKNAYLRLCNPKTGREIFCVADRMLEGDVHPYTILGNVFIPTPEECEKNPRLHGLEIHILVK